MSLFICNLEVVTLPGMVVAGFREIVHVKINALLPGTQVPSPLALPGGSGAGHTLCRLWVPVWLGGLGLEWSVWGKHLAGPGETTREGKLCFQIQRFKRFGGWVWRPK